MAKIGSIIRCGICGKEFTVRFKKEKYCCKECYQEACAIKMSDFYWQKADKNGKGVPKEKECLYCGKTFTTRNSRIKCCSGACTHAYKRATDKTNVNTFTPEDAVCRICGKYYVKTFLEQICCSQDCTLQYYRERSMEKSVQMAAKKNAETNTNTKAKRRRKPKPLSKVLEEMKKQGFEPHEYGKYMAIQYMKENR